MANEQAALPVAPGDPSPPLMSRYGSLGYVINLAARLFERALAERIAPLGLTTGQFPVLLALWERDGLTQTELAQIVRVEQPTMAQTLSRMERDGLIVRKPDPADGRRAVVRLTERGRAVQAPAVTAALEINRRASRGLSAAQQQAMLDTMMMMAANLVCEKPPAP
ncbi:MarR family winged helix-turn-helix transcriptional regulator [Blastochloris viridis]|uniref:Organic hydroperoxide resistance transcriptionalregulator n=1 Tax=Blastochloris viridis TaxID=1079 RepID=A0A0H5BB51_BLAVI|nr:MarR family transcriptional regulator [Blastochloris viridis]ALK10564.1 Organic hydroperoxide resistance transcriptional regulator [Blastochloris viridis]BAR99482.1 transcriptional regulator [Blastochloris viridis]CUU43226.1 Organic hydroperoxide resistance transcriptionalregulator [Blastochloris viridis]